MKKKILAALLCCAMLFVFAGCTEKAPTVQELLDGIKAVESDQYQDLGLSMTMSGDQDGQSMLMQINGGIEMRDGIVHIYDMAVSIGMQGLDLQMDMEGWSDLKAGVTYTNVTALGENSGWTKSYSDDDESDFDISGLLDKFSKLDESKLTLQEHVKGDDWVLVWDMDAGELDEMVSEAAEYGVDGSQLGTLTGAAKFDEKTRELKAIEVASSGIESDGVSDVRILFTFKTLNDAEKTLEIPAEVLENAVEEELDLFGNGDDGYETEWSEEGFLDGEDYDYSGDGGSVTVDGEGYDDIIDPMAEKVAAADKKHKGVYVYHFDGMSQLNYSTGGLNWIGDVTVQHMNPEEWMSAEEEFISNVEWLKSYYEMEPTSGSIEEKSVMFARLESGMYEIDLVGWNDDMYIAADMYTYNDMSADEAVEHLNEMLTTAGVN